MKKMGIREKLILVNLGVSMTIFFVIGLIFYLQFEKNVLSDADRDLINSSDIVTKAIQAKFTPIDFYYSTADLEMIIPKNMIAEIIAFDGEVIFKNKGITKPIVLNSKETQALLTNNKIVHTMENTRILLSAFTFFGKNYVLIIGKDIENLNKIISRNIFLIAVTLVILFAVSGISLYYITSRVLKAVKKITTVSRAIEKEKMGHRIDERYGTQEIDELVETFNEMLDRIEKAFERVAMFTSDVSHELKTPISSIKSMIEVELIQQRSAEEYREVMINILEEINWLGNIINDLLLMTRLEAGNETLNKKETNLKKAVLDVCDLMQISAMEEDVKIITEDVDDVTAFCDESKIKRVILNLVSNGIKYNKRYGRVYVLLKKTNGFAEIIVKDTGIGIKKENAAKIFDRFYREDKIRTVKKSGTGLGLAIVSFIVELHKGTISVESEENTGSEFKVKIPL